MVSERGTIGQEWGTRQQMQVQESITIRIPKMVDHQHIAFI